MGKNICVISGIGLDCDELEPYLSAKKLGALMKKWYPNDREIEDLLAGDYSVDDIDSLLWDNYAGWHEVLCDMDDTHVLTWDTDVYGSHWLVYPPSMPWQRCENEPQTPDEAVDRIVKVIRQVSDLSDDKIRDMIGWDVESYGD